MPSLKEVKLLIYSPLSLELQGGGERWLAEIAPRLKEYKIIPTIVTTDFLPKHYQPKSPTWHLQQFLRANIAHFRLSTYRLFQSLNLPILTPRSWVDLIRLVEKHDVVYFLNAYAFQDLSMMVVKHIAGVIPIICGQHAALLQNGVFHNAYVSLVTRSTLRSFDAFHVLNMRDAQMFSKWGLRNVYLIPNGVDTEIFLNTDHFNKNKFSVLYVGRLDEQKGLDILLSAIEYLEILNSTIDKVITFQICGNGPMSDDVRKFAQKRENVDYLGFVSEDELLELYKAADLLAMPSRHETFGLVAVEAMASGLPVIASDIPGPQEIIQENYGQLIQVGDHKSLANAILHFHTVWSDNPGKYDTMRLQARKHIESKYDWKIIIKHLVAMIRKTLYHRT